MATTPNLGITHLTQGQNQKHVTVNDALDILDGAVAGYSSGAGFDFPSDADFTPTATLVQASFSILIAGTITVTREWIVPLTPHMYIIENATVSGADDITIIGVTGTGVTLAHGDRKLLYCDGTNVMFATGISPYEMGGFLSGIPAISTQVYKVVVARTVTFPDDFVGSQGHAETAPSGGGVDFDVQVNTVSIGTMTFASASNTATFVTAATTVDLIPGDRLEVHTPGDLRTMADVSFMFTGERA
jgi:hypothetical protein